MDEEGRLVAEQVAYYRARASEYDVTSLPDGDPLAAYADRIRAALRAVAPAGRVLEIAAGTGLWTGILAETAGELVVTDASPEMLELNQARHGGLSNLRWQVADAFTLEASHGFDVAFCGFFLSHVPPGRFAAFWAVLEGVLGAGGRVIVVDEADHGLWEEDWIDRQAGIVRRPLTDGTVHRAVKVLWAPRALERRLSGLGWDATAHVEGPFFWLVASKVVA
jgi:ubiquinone/menaquinone biosynthesis C-methylase UbiE